MWWCSHSVMILTSALFLYWLMHSCSPHFHALSPEKTLRLLFYLFHSATVSTVLPDFKALPQERGLKSIDDWCQCAKLQTAEDLCSIFHRQASDPCRGAWLNDLSLSRLHFSTLLLYFIKSLQCSYFHQSRDCCPSDESGLCVHVSFYCKNKSSSLDHWCWVLARHHKAKSDGDVWVRVRRCVIWGSSE